MPTPLTPTDAALLASKALDGELAADESAALSAARASSRRVQAAAAKVEAAHTHLSALRAAATAAVSGTAELAEQLFAAFRERIAPLATRRLRLPEVMARDGAHAEDVELAMAAVQGDEHAQREVYFGHIALVQHLVRTRRLTSHGDDIAQDIFFRVFDRLHTYRGESSLKTWIHRVAVNHINNVLTRDVPKRARELNESALDVPEGGQSVIEAAVDGGALQDTQLEQAERHAIVSAALHRLPAASRTVVELKEIDGLTCEEIAAMLAVPMGTVQSRLARGRAKLAEYLAADSRAVAAR